MQSATFTFENADGIDVFVYHWAPEGDAKGVVQITHGMQEHAGRYAETAEALCEAGFVVYANDQQGHGKTAGSLERYGKVGPRGYEGILDDMKRLTDRAREENPGLPIFLMGHSWGSFMTQAYIQRWGDGLKGAVLSGTNGKNPLVKPGVLLARMVVSLRGADTTAVLLHHLSMGHFNKKFGSDPKGHEWISRDPEVVKEFEADPFCGGDFPNAFFLMLVELLSNTWDRASEARVPKGLPLYLFAGSDDPVGLETEGIVALMDRYRDLGVRDIHHKFYPGGRHEMLLETNREEVWKELIAWLDAHL
jgi:alpha-beta hydrolase superfamily lysophospholipase